MRATLDVTEARIYFLRSLKGYQFSSTSSVVPSFPTKQIFYNSQMVRLYQKASNCPSFPPVHRRFEKRALDLFDITIKSAKIAPGTAAMIEQCSTSTMIP